MTKTTRFSLLAAAIVTAAAPPAALARKSPLEGQPAVRHKLELRASRLEVAPTFELTVQADYKHTVAGGLKLEYHLSDQLSVGALLFFGAALDTALSSAIRDSLPENRDPAEPRTPSRDDFDNHLNTMPFHGGFGATYTPFFGKMSIFSKVFVNYDIYLSGGLGFAQTKNDFVTDTGEKTDGCDPQSDGADPMTGETLFNDPRNDCPHNSGFNPGLQLGAGLHVFVNRWVAVDLYFRDYLFTDNPSGLDFDGDLDVDSDDRRFLSHLFFGVGVSMYLPTKAKISR